VRLHWTFRDDLIVDVELRCAERLAVFARVFSRKLDANRVLTGLQFGFETKRCSGLIPRKS
jgi:hypothetical protein